MVNSCENLFLNLFPSISIDFGLTEAEFLLGFKIDPILAQTANFNELYLEDEQELKKKLDM